MTKQAQYVDNTAVSADSLAKTGVPVTTFVLTAAEPNPKSSRFPASVPSRILVSDEMIDAGVYVLSRSDRDYETDASIVRSVFLAMVRAGVGR